MTLVLLLGEGNGSELEITHKGTADGIVTATIVDPTATTGDELPSVFLITTTN